MPLKFVSDVLKHLFACNIRSLIQVKIRKFLKYLLVE